MAFVQFARIGNFQFTQGAKLTVLHLTTNVISELIVWFSITEQ